MQRRLLRVVGYMRTIFLLYDDLYDYDILPTIRQQDVETRTVSQSKQLLHV